jgi:hypothetical protein
MAGWSMWTKEYTWLEVNERQALLRKVKKGPKTIKEGLFDHHTLEKY